MAIRKGRKRAAPATQPKRRPKEVDEVEEEEAVSGKMLLRPWLKSMVGEIAGLKWMDPEQTMLRIPWMHGSSKSWDSADAQLFTAWARHSGQLPILVYYRSMLYLL
jgi:hypothetical protein